MKSTVEVSNKYVSTIAEGSSIGTAPYGSFSVTSVSKDGYALPSGEKTFFLIVDYGTANEEIFRIWKRDGNVCHYDKRLAYPNGTKSHASGSSVQLNDLAEIVNELSASVDDFGRVEKADGYSPQRVTVKGGYAQYNTDNNALATLVPTATLEVGANIMDNTTSYVCFDFGTGTFVSKLAVGLGTLTGVVLAIVTVSGGVITSITDVRKNNLGHQFDGDVFQSVGGKVVIRNNSVPIAKLSGAGLSAGQYIYWDGSQFVTGTPLGDTLPSKDGNAGKVLSTDGSVLQWVTPST